MKHDWKKSAASVIASLSPSEREASIVYLEKRVFAPGEAPVCPECKGNEEEPLVIAFVDLEPGLNWAHRGRYVILDGNNRVLRVIEVSHPPFLTGVSPDLRLIYRGKNAPEWAAVTLESIDD